MALRLLRQDEAEVWAAKAEKYLPRSRTVHGYLSIGLKKNFFNLDEIHFYVPNDETLPFFMIIDGISGRKDVQSCTPFWDPEEFDEDVILKLLTSIPKWNWQTAMFFYMCNISALRYLEHIILNAENGLGGGKVVFQASKSPEGNSFTIHTIDEKICKFPIDEYILDFVHEDYAEYLYDNWIYKKYYGLDFVKRTLKYMPAIGAYVRQSGSMNNRSLKPVSWTMAKHNGEIGMTHTMPEHRGKGLAGAVTLKLAKMLFAQGIIPWVAIPHYNSSSIKLHEKLGFEKEELSTMGYHTYDLISDK